jgi:hypothetical protein
VKHVYILESLDSGLFYVGITDDPDARLTGRPAYAEIPTVADQNLYRLQRRETGLRF